MGVSNFSAQRVRRAAQLLGARGLPLASNQVRGRAAWTRVLLLAVNPKAVLKANGSVRRGQAMPWVVGPHCAPCAPVCPRGQPCGTGQENWMDACRLPVVAVAWSSPVHQVPCDQHAPRGTVAHLGGVVHLGEGCHGLAQCKLATHSTLACTLAPAFALGMRHLPRARRCSTACCTVPPRPTAC